jgi:hypothetical protein
MQDIPAFNGVKSRADTPLRRRIFLASKRAGLLTHGLAVEIAGQFFGYRARFSGRIGLMEFSQVRSSVQAAAMAVLSWQSGHMPSEVGMHQPRSKPQRRQVRRAVIARSSATSWAALAVRLGSARSTRYR